MKWTLVTGGAKGIGAAIALALAKQGHNIVIHYRKSKDEAQRVATTCLSWGGAAEICQGDFAHKAGVTDFLDRYLQKYESTFGLVHNVGNYLIKPIEESSSEEWQQLFQTNLFAPITLMNRLSDSLKKSRGRVVGLGTVGLSSSRGYKKAAAYSISKVALYQTLLSYAKVWSGEGVTVNMVSPGYVETAVDLGESHLPMGRGASIEEISRVVAFLFATESSYITGQNIEVAGGFGL